MNSNQKKPVRCVETGEVFESLSAAGRFIGSSESRGPDNHGVVHSHVSHAANRHGQNKTAGGYHWEFIHRESEVSSKFPQKKEEDSLPKIYKSIKKEPPKQPRIDYPPEGYVYVFRNRWHPEGVYKIGSTDNLEGRRSAARTWGPYSCSYYLEVDDCKAVESLVHERLKEYSISSDDIGKEHFGVPLQVAKAVINDAAFDLACSHPKCAEAA